MPSHDLPAESIDRASEELTDFSASRLTLAGKCGLAFEYQYVRKLPAPFDRNATLFGDVVHNGIQKWFEIPDEGWRETDLAPIVLAEWERVYPKEIWKRVLEIRDLDQECDAVCAAILFNRPTLKNVRQTKAFMESDAAKALNDAKAKILELCDALPDIKWPKDEDPYKSYQKSALIAEAAQRRWQDKPAPLAIERPFRIEVEGFVLRGRIDAIRRDPTPAGEVWTGMVDYKTGRQALTAMEAFLQAFIYTEAVATFEDILEQLGADYVPDFAFWLARQDKYQQGRIDRARHRRLASRILNDRARAITMGQFAPHYGMWCKMCDFSDVCTREISLWDGEDGMTLELIAS